MIASDKSAEDDQADSYIDYIHLKISVACLGIFHLGWQNYLCRFHLGLVW